MKLLGAIVIAISAIMVGIRLAAELRYREHLAEISCYCVEEIKNEIRYTRKESRQLLKDMQKKYPQLQWLKSKGNDELSMLGKDFCRELGAGDLQSQIELCDMYTYRFGKLQKQYMTQKEEKERLYISLGAFSGIALFILFI